MDAKFYLNVVELLDALKTKAQGLSHNWGAGLVTGKPDRADPRDVFRVAKKALADKFNSSTTRATEFTNIFTDGVLCFGYSIRTERSRKASIPILVQVSTQTARTRCANSCALRNGNSAQGYYAIQRIITTREREKKQQAGVLTSLFRE